MKINIICKVLFEAVHCWPECDIESVSFLKNPHRHIFHVVAKKRVSHKNRDIEIISFGNNIKKYCEGRALGGLGSMSCEDIAAELSSQFELSYCSVLEDNENGAEVYS